MRSDSCAGGCTGIHAAHARGSCSGRFRSDSFISVANSVTEQLDYSVRAISREPGRDWSTLIVSTMLATIEQRDAELNSRARSSRNAS